MSDRHPKKRSRIALSCNYCKKRKVKCDRGKPCSSCIRYKVAELCDYPEPMWAEPTSGSESGSTYAGPPGARSASEKDKHSNIGMLPTFSVKKLNTAPSATKSEEKKKHKHKSSPPNPVDGVPQPPIVFQASQAHFSVYNSNRAAYNHLSPNMPHTVQQAQHQLQLQPPPPSVPLHVAETPASPGLQSELDQLKEKIKTIEASLSQGRNNSIPSYEERGMTPSIVGAPSPAAYSSAATPSYPPPPQPVTQNYPGTPYSTPGGPSAQPASSAFTPRFNYHLSNTRTKQVPIQLPPINWTNNGENSSEYPTTTCKADNIPDDVQDALNGTSRGSKDESNKIYVAINPYSCDSDSINFYEGYTPIHIKDASRRMNFGPFAWLSLMKKDPGLLSLWRFMFTSKFESLRSVPGPKGEDVTLAPFSTILSYKPVAAGFTSPEGRTVSEVQFRERALDRDGYTDLRSYGEVKKSQKSTPQSIDESRSSIDGSDRTTSTDATSVASKLDVKPDASDQLTKSETQQLQRSAMNKNAISLGLTLYEGQIDQELQLIEKIKMLLPKKKVIWKLVDRFFTTIYPFMPIVDEELFRAELNRILGPPSYEDETLEELRVERRLDFAQIGILLIMLRLTYLSIFSNRNADNEMILKSTDPSEKAQELKYLLVNPINIDIIDMAQLCLDQFDVLRKTNLVVLQCAFFMRTYHMYSPEDGDGADGGDSQIFNGMLIQMAYSLGVNREPDLFDELAKDPKTNNLTRKMWFYLIMGDLGQAFKYGNPLSIDHNYYDTKLPYYSPECSNNSDQELEKSVIYSFEYMELYYWKVMELMRICLSIRESTKLSKLVGKISSLESYMSDQFSSLKVFTKPFNAEIFRYPFLKVMQCRNYIHMKGLLLNVFFHIYLYFEKDNKIEFSYFYLRKMLSIIHCELIPGFFPLILNNKENFGEGSDLILNPSIESLIHKTSQLIVAVLVRVNSSIYQYKHDPNHQENLKTNYLYKVKFFKLCHFSKIQERSLKFCMVAMSKLSQRYYYAWRISKAHTFLLKLISGEDFYKFMPPGNDQVRFLPIGVDQIDELSKICESSMRKYAKTKMFYSASELLDDINIEDIDLESNAFKMRSQGQPVPGQQNPNSHQFTGFNQSPMGGNIFPNGYPAVNSPYGQTTPSQGGYKPNFSSSVDSTNTSEQEEFQFVENADIDRLWFQMANMKNDNTSVGGYANGTYGNGEYDQNGENGLHPPHGGPGENGGATQGQTPVYNPSFIPTPMIPLSPDSLNSQAQRARLRRSSSNVHDPNQNYDENSNFPMTSNDVFNNFAIDQLLGMETIDSW